MMFSYAISIFLASAQLFLVQPMFAKRLLPVLGGTPAVWTTCMLFYQVVLLGGYVYAHVITSEWNLRRQMLAHSVLLVLPLVVLAIGPPNWNAPDPSNTVSWLLSYLAATVGLPFFVLSTNSPLVQRWYSLCVDSKSKNAYHLYSASNLGSMVALIAYPAIIEPSLTLKNQYVLFIWLYSAFATVMLFIIWKLRKRVPELSVNDPSVELNHPIAKLTDQESKARWIERSKWLLIAFIPSSLLLSLTSYVTSNIAPCPLFWIVPLALYLLTFIMAFSPRRLISKKWLLSAHAILLIVLSVAFYWNYVEFNTVVTFSIHLLTFFVIALLCHSRLADEAPDVSRLTEFYFCLAAGGALGGIFNTLIAPHIFMTPIEYPIVLALSCIARTPVDISGKRLGWRFGSAMLALCLLAIAICNVFVDKLSVKPTAFSDYLFLLAVGPAALFAGLASVEPLFFMGCIAVLLFVGAASTEQDVLCQGRNIFGHLMVIKRNGDEHCLVHGNIVHGAEFMSGPKAHEPLTYYNSESPIAHIFTAYESQFQQKNIAVLGLGAGTMAAYARPGQNWTFYEINPMVVDLASNPTVFTYLSSSRAPYKIILGDGRQQIAHAPDQKYSLIALDAFSSDSIAVHLLTREALQIYLSKLAPGGLIAFHISSRFVDLIPPLRELALDAHLAYVAEFAGPKSASKTFDKSASLWFVMARSRADLEPLKSKFNFVVPSMTPRASLWTDDFSNLVGSLKLN